MLEGLWLVPATPGADLDVFKALWVIKGRTSNKDSSNKENSNLKRHMPPVFIAALFIMPRRRSSLNVCPQTNGRRRRGTCMPREGMKPRRAATRMHIEIVMLSEVNQTQVKYHMIFLV